MNPREKFRPLSSAEIGAYAIVAVLSFHASWITPFTASLAAVFMYCVFQLTRLPSYRWTIYGGIPFGLALYAPHLAFFWRIFGAAAAALWLVLVFWLVVFLVLARAWVRRVPAIWAVIGVPILWIAIEFYRSELYFLKFSWLSPGYTASVNPSAAGIHLVGVYGASFVLLLICGIISLLPRRIAIASGCVLFGVWTAAIAIAKPASPETSSGPLLVGIQLEHPDTATVLAGLNDALERHPDGDLFVLSEYTFNGPVPDEVRDWARTRGRHLIVGGVDRLREGEYNTAFVVDPDGNIVFRQAKSVPIQFFADGLPAKRQKLWDSPWGPIGICICYDLSYTRVTDVLVRMGARLLIVPTMDVEGWGRWEHLLHRRVAMIRAAEYGLPIFRVASSGYSQVVDSRGREPRFASFPGQGEIIASKMEMGRAGSIPVDRALIRFAVPMAAAWALVFPFLAIRDRVAPRRDRATSSG